MLRLTRLTETLLIVFLGLSCVFWLPGLPIGLLSAIKSVCLFGGGGLAVYYAIRRGAAGLPTGVSGLTGILGVVVFSLPAFLQADLADAGRWAYNYAITFTTLIVMFMYARAGGDVHRIVRGSALLLSVLVVLAFAAAVTNYQGVLSPAEYGLRTIRENGFASSRASWSVGLCVFFPVAFMVFAEHYRVRRNLWNFSILLLVVTSFIGSQLLSGGRTGLLASLVVLGFLVWRMFGGFWLIALYGAAATAAYMNLTFLSDQLRLTGATTLDDASSGRLDGYEAAIQAFWNHPFTGQGFGMVSTLTRGGDDIDIHNLWLFLLASGGIGLTAAITVFLTALLWRSWPLYWRGWGLWQAAPLVFLAAYVACLLEPAVLFGAFQTTALFWFMAGIVRGGEREESHRSELQSFLSSSPYQTVAIISGR